jgi:hypothetical protein
VSSLPRSCRLVAVRSLQWLSRWWRRTLQLDKLLLTPDEQHVKMNNFEMAKQFSQWLGCDSSQAWKVSHCDDGDPDERHTNRGPASPKVGHALYFSIEAVLTVACADFTLPVELQLVLLPARVDHGPGP